MPDETHHIRRVSAGVGLAGRRRHPEGAFANSRWRVMDLAGALAVEDIELGVPYGHYCCLVVSCIACVMTSLAGYAYTPTHLVIVIGIPVQVVVIFCQPNRINVQKAIRKVHGAIWVATVVLYWLQIITGMSPRLAADEAEPMIYFACFWVLAMILPHVLRVAAWQRAVVYMGALSMDATSPHWGRHLLLSQLAGEAVGLVLEKMVLTIEQARRHNADLEGERRKEMIAKQVNARAAAGNRRGDSKVTFESGPPVGSVSRDALNSWYRQQLSGHARKRRVASSVDGDCGSDRSAELSSGSR